MSGAPGIRIPTWRIFGCALLLVLTGLGTGLAIMGLIWRMSE